MSRPSKVIKSLNHYYQNYRKIPFAAKKAIARELIEEADDIELDALLGHRLFEVGFIASYFWRKPGTKAFAEHVVSIFDKHLKDKGDK